jgi:hypothetical protein
MTSRWLWLPICAAVGCNTMHVRRAAGPGEQIRSVALLALRGTPADVADKVREGCSDEARRRGLRVEEVSHIDAQLDEGANWYQTVGSAAGVDAFFWQRFSFTLANHWLTTLSVRLVSARTGSILASVLVEPGDFARVSSVAREACGALLDAARR